MAQRGDKLGMGKWLLLGDIVRDLSDPKHIGEITRVGGVQGDSRVCMRANIKWLKTGWRSLNVSADDLELVLTRDQRAELRKDLSDEQLHYRVFAWYIEQDMERYEQQRKPVPKAVPKTCKLIPLTKGKR